jgi:hypothetical protein
MQDLDTIRRHGIVSALAPFLRREPCPGCGATIKVPDRADTS